jgi:hypothetical protein
MPAAWRRLLAAAAFVAVGQQVREGDNPRTRVFATPFHVAAPGEVVATIRAASCGRCSWGTGGREATGVQLTVDGRYSQNLVLARGSEVASYRVTLGAFEPGRHILTISVEPRLTAAQADDWTVEGATFDVLDRATEASVAQSMAPILHARPNTVGKFTDLPILMWYEVQPTPRGRQFRYSVVFTNEDGGTATDRLMATWGRTTDIEFVYGVELDATGAVMREEFQGPGHEVPPFNGRHDGRHPLLWIATDNNMVSDTGTITVRYAPAPERVDLTGVSREAVMDAHPWSYQLAAQELVREGKIATGGSPARGQIADPRRYVVVEACTELSNAALAFSVRAKSESGVRWYDADLGLPEFRIVRAGCFRGAVALPESSTPDALRFRALSKPAEAGKVSGPSAARVTRVNKVFGFGGDYLPRASLFQWIGSLPLPIDGGWRELPF